MTRAYTNVEGHILSNAPEMFAVSTLTKEHGVRLVQNALGRAQTVVESSKSSRNIDFVSVFRTASEDF